MDKLKRENKKLKKLDGNKGDTVSQDMVKGEEEVLVKNEVSS